jgi:hypothetical protein
VRLGLESAGDRSPDEIIRTLVAAGDSWMQGAVQDDDITLMVIKRNI